MRFAGIGKENTAGVMSALRAPQCGQSGTRGQIP